MLVSDVQPLKAPPYILVTLSPSITLSSEVHPLNAYPTSSVLIVACLSDVQSAKAYQPILVTLSGIVTLASEVQSLKAEIAIVFVPCFISTLPDISLLTLIK